MKTQMIPAIFRDGILEPLELLSLENNQTVYVTIETEINGGGGKASLEAWQAVYDDFSDEEIGEVEEIILDRDKFMQRSAS